MATVTERVSDAAHRVGDSVSHAAHRAADGLRDLRTDIRSEASILEHKAEDAVNRALVKIENDTSYLGARITSKFNYLPFGPLSAALVWPTLAASGALLLYEYQGLEVNRARFARRSALLKPAEAASASAPEEPFERLYRLHQQTGESLITLVPSLYAFSLLVSPRWAFALGSGWLASRILYLYAHKFGLESTVEKPAYALSYMAQMALLMGSAVNATRWSIGMFLTWLGSFNEEAVPATVPVLLAPGSIVVERPIARAEDLSRYP